MMKMDRKRVWMVLAGVAVVLAAAGGMAYSFFFARNLPLAQAAYLYVDRDDTADSVFCKLQEAVAPRSICGFRWLAGCKDYARHVFTGCYPVCPDDNMLDLYLRLSRNHQVPVDVSFHNIRTKGQLAARLGAQLMIDSAEIAGLLHDSAYCRRMGFTLETIPCMFIPNTYELYWNVSADALFKRMKREYDAFWTPSRKAKAQAAGLSPEEVIILASIVEEETNASTEKPVVAGLYINRLRRGMPLQADPTVKFAWQDFGLKRIYNRHLQIDSPYNTYKHAGLPPGPIRLPSVTGIDSVLDYARHSYLYMCAKEDFYGLHRFSSTLAGHQANARRYWQALNKRKIF